MALHQIELDKSTEDALTELRKLINTFHQLVNHDMSRDKLTGRVKFALSMGAATCEYADAISILCSQRKSKSCGPLIRSMFEGRISVMYVLGGKDNARLNAAIVSGLKINKEMIANLLKYMDELDVNELGDFRRATLESLKSEREKDIAQVETELRNSNNPEFKNKTSLPRLYERAKQIDLDRLVKPESSVYLNYLTVYSVMSGPTHLGLDELPNWLSESEDTVDLNVSETFENAHTTIILAFCLFTDIAAHVLRELGLDYKQLLDFTEASLRKVGTYKPVQKT